MNKYRAFHIIAYQQGSRKVKSYLNMLNFMKAWILCYVTCNKSVYAIITIPYRTDLISHLIWPLHTGQLECSSSNWYRHGEWKLWPQGVVGTIIVASVSNGAKQMVQQLLLPSLATISLLLLMWNLYPKADRGLSIERSIACWLSSPVTVLPTATPPLELLLVELFIM